MTEESDGKKLECTKCGWKGEAKECDVTNIERGMSVEALMNFDSYYVCPNCGEYRFMR